MKNLGHSIPFPFLWIRQLLQRFGRWIAYKLEDSNLPYREGKRNSIAVLDGVRAIAILMVIVFHINRITGDSLWNQMANPLASSVATAGGTGVTLFFVLSGFLLFMPFAKALLFDTPWPLARVFYLRRVLRIMPGYYVSLFLLILFMHPEYLQRDHLKDLLLFLTFFMDSSHSTFRQLNGPFWTLATEWQFYMLLPLICLAFALFVRQIPLHNRFKAVTFCILVVIAWGLFVRYFGLYYLNHPEKTVLVPRPVLNILLFFSFGITGKYTEDFAVGMFISLCYMYAQNPSTRRKFGETWARLSPWLWGGGIVVLTFGAMWHFNDASRGWSFLNGLLPVYDWLSEMILSFGFGACIAAILYGTPAFKRVFEWAPLRWIGLISYSLYMWHLPLLVIFTVQVAPWLHLTNKFVVYGLLWLWAFVVVFPFAFISFIMVEKPWMKLGDRWRRDIEKKHREKLKAREAEAISPSMAIEEANAVPQEAVTK